MLPARAAAPAEWSDWRWQLRNRIRDLAGLERVIRLSDDERAALLDRRARLPVSITPYYAKLLDPDRPDQPLRRSILGCNHDSRVAEWESLDPLHEDAFSPVPGLFHRYPDRVLFLATSVCPVYCRYCTRSRLVGKPAAHSATRQWDQAIEYIAAHPAIRDVLISGGDPLMLSDHRLDSLLARLRRIPHVEFLRIGTKTPAVLPQRITPALTRMLRHHQPLWLTLHFIHPDD